MIDGKVECVEMGQGLEALRKQREVTVAYAAALQPEQLQGKAMAQSCAKSDACHSPDGISM
jgi:hypothetical protein